MFSRQPLGVVAMPIDSSYFGCFDLGPITTALPAPTPFDALYQSGALNGTVSLHSCSAACSNARAGVFALQQGACACGSHLPSEASRVADRSCSSPCPGAAASSAALETSCPQRHDTQLWSVHYSNFSLPAFPPGTHPAPHRETPAWTLASCSVAGAFGTTLLCVLFWLGCKRCRTRTQASSHGCWPVKEKDWTSRPSSAPHPPTLPAVVVPDAPKDTHQRRSSWLFKGKFLPCIGAASVESVLIEARPPSVRRNDSSFGIGTDFDVLDRSHGHPTATTVAPTELRTSTDGRPRHPELYEIERSVGTEEPSIVVASQHDLGSSQWHPTTPTRSGQPTTPGAEHNPTASPRPFYLAPVSEHRSLQFQIRHGPDFAVGSVSSDSSDGGHGYTPDPSSHGHGASLSHGPPMSGGHSPLLRGHSWSTGGHYGHNWPIPRPIQLFEPQVVPPTFGLKPTRGSIIKRITLDFSMPSSSTSLRRGTTDVNQRLGRRATVLGSTNETSWIRSVLRGATKNSPPSTPLTSTSDLEQGPFGLGIWTSAQSSLAALTAADENGSAPSTPIAAATFPVPCNFLSTSPTVPESARCTDPSAQSIHEVDHVTRSVASNLVITNAADSDLDMASFGYPSRSVPWRSRLNSVGSFGTATSIMLDAAPRLSIANPDGSLQPYSIHSQSIDSLPTTTTAATNVNHRSSSMNNLSLSSQGRRVVTHQSIVLIKPPSRLSSTQSIPEQ